MELKWLAFIQIQRLPPRMHYKWKEIIDLYSKQLWKIGGHQLTMKIRVDLRDNSII
jgi:hypothetical protein